MEVFPGAYIAKLSVGAASALSCIVVAILSHRTGTAVRIRETTTTTVLPCTTSLAFVTAFTELVLVADSTLGDDDRQQSRQGLASGETVDRVWAGLIWAVWLVDVVFVTRLAVYGSGDWSAATCSQIGALVAFVWVQWMLLTSRILIMIAETARIRLQHMMEALRGKLAPWWNAAKEPFVQVLASFGILLSGVVGSVAMLVTGVVGIFDKALGLVGLGGIRSKIFDSLGLRKVTDGIDQQLSGVGLGGIVGDGDHQDPAKGGMDAILKEFGVGGDKDGAGVEKLSKLNPLGQGDGGGPGLGGLSEMSPLKGQAESSTTRKRAASKKSK